MKRESIKYLCFTYLTWVLVLPPVSKRSQSLFSVDEDTQSSKVDDIVSGLCCKLSYKGLVFMVSSHYLSQFFIKFKDQGQI